ncbi:hypothetical protein CONLIGDRAFT_698959 [Coniochaeta ligniaria NRRL 30616]|uniref:Uncharacterized protein n=1 Tax=Coniochaeta ligniaria NRRL 30616 TaxID=1408157 RepID=A0A1J7JX01_9PEZI|nr:hypothetical protein CONLIGDRAFT_698959 [Coniochaeta ligniaria NRRL 30616]
MGRLTSLTKPKPRPEAHRPGKCARVTIVVTVAALLWISWSNLVARWTTDRTPKAHHHGAGDNKLMTDWDLIEPSEDLHWVPCLDEFLCARLTVPLDYSRPLNSSTSLMRPGPQLHIALVMLPGKNHTESGAWSESPLLVNPGGPGGSGTSLVVSAGRAHQEIAGSDLDIIGFDPRGIGATTPQADCFSDIYNDVGARSLYERRASKEGSLLRRVLWLAGNEVVGLPNTSDTATEQVVFRQRGLTKLCNPQDHPDSILRYAGTPNVAQDMLSIVQAWDRWTSALQRKPDEAPPESNLADNHSQPPSTRGKLVYWGFSYGTILGATFAAMFPEYVGRLVLDGVVNSDEWYFENSWMNAVQDTDKVMERFRLYCYQAKERCHLYREGDKLDDVTERFDSILNSLADQPRVYAIKGLMPVYVSYSTVKALLFSATYVPAVFPIVAIILDALYRGVDLTSLMGPIDLSPLCESKPRDPRVHYPDDGGTAVLCSDQRFRLNVTRSGLQTELKKMTDVSSFGDTQAFTIASRCVGWDIDHVDPPSMDWSKFPLKDKDPVNTSFPILFVSNSRDPVTPIRSGLEQSRKFLDSGFIEQKAEGHCSSSMVSLCTMQKIHAYFSKGIVPDKPRFDDSADAKGSLTGNWTTCEVDQRPWGVPGLDLRTESKYSAEELVLFRAGAHLQHTFKNRVQLLPHAHGFEKLFEMAENEVEELLATAISRITSGA